MFDFKEKLSSFWTIQFIGWIVYFVMIYITFLSVAQPGNFLRLFYIKAFRTLTGFFLTSVLMRPLYRRFGNKFSISGLVLLVLTTSAIFGMAWTAIEFCYGYFT